MLDMMYAFFAYFSFVEIDVRALGYDNIIKILCWMEKK